LTSCSAQDNAPLTQLPAAPSAVSSVPHALSPHSCSCRRCGSASARCSCRSSRRCLSWVQRRQSLRHCAPRLLRRIQRSAGPASSSRCGGERAVVCCVCAPCWIVSVSYCALALPLQAASKYETAALNVTMQLSEAQRELADVKGARDASQVCLFVRRGGGDVGRVGRGGGMLAASGCERVLAECCLGCSAPQACSRAHPTHPPSRAQAEVARLLAELEQLRSVSGDHAAAAAECARLKGGSAAAAPASEIVDSGLTGSRAAEQAEHPSWVGLAPSLLSPPYSLVTQCH
jgi:hypothetical protein